VLKESARSNTGDLMIVVHHWQGCNMSEVFRDNRRRMIVADCIEMTSLLRDTWDVCFSTALTA